MNFHAETKKFVNLGSFQHFNALVAKMMIIIIEKVPKKFFPLKRNCSIGSELDLFRRMFNSDNMSFVKIFRGLELTEKTFNDHLSFKGNKHF